MQDNTRQYRHGADSHVICYWTQMFRIHARGVPAKIMQNIFSDSNTRHINYRGSTKATMTEVWAYSKTRGAYWGSRVNPDFVWKRVASVQAERSKVEQYKAQRAEAVKRRDEAQKEINEIDCKMREAGWSRALLKGYRLFKTTRKQ